MDVIKQWIDESDVYLLILAGRYGSIEPKSGKSYTHLEYEYALNKNKPLFACVIREDALDARVKTHGVHMIDKHQKELEGFRALVQTKMVKFWDSKDIKIAIGETLNQFGRRDGLVGWVRSSHQADVPALADEMARLSKENAELRNRVALGTEGTLHGLTYTQLKDILKRKAVWEFVLSNRQQLATGILSGKEVIVLEGLGLMERGTIGSSWLFPTDTGRIFLNRVELDNLEQPEVGKARGSTNV
jgi:hypothetical protein